MKYLASSILALAGLAILTSQASAATTPDLILGFQASSGTGNTINLEIDLGSATQFFGGGTYTTAGQHLLGNIATDLGNTYGSWASTKLVSFGVIGTEQSNIGTLAPDGQPKGTLYASRAETTPGTASSAWTNSTQSAQKQSGSQIINVYNGVTAATPTGNFAGAVTTPTSDANSYTTIENAGPNGSQFSYFQIPPGIDHLIDFTNGSTVVSDLYQVEPNNTALNSVNRLGGFSLSNTGDLVFDTNVTDFGPAVPEPATFGFGFAMVGACFIRRSRAVAIA